MQPPARLSEEDARQAVLVLTHSIVEKMLPSIFDIARLCPAVPMNTLLMQAIEWAITEADTRLQSQGWTLQSVTIDLYREWLTSAERTREREKPGIKATTGEEHMVILMQWATYRRDGYSQQKFAENMGWDSRTPLTNALRWYKTTYHKNF